MIEHHYIAEAGSEKEIAITPDGTFTRYRSNNRVDKKTEAPVYGRWSPWLSEATMRDSGEPVYLASK